MLGMGESVGSPGSTGILRILARNSGSNMWKTPNLANPHYGLGEYDRFSNMGLNFDITVSHDLFNEVWLNHR